MNEPKKNKSYSVSGMERITTHRVISQKGGAKATVEIYATDMEAIKHLGPFRPPRPPRMMPDPRRRKE